MFCEECGKQIPDNSKFCDGCGAPVKPLEGPESRNLAGGPPYGEARPPYGETRPPYGNPFYENAPYGRQAHQAGPVYGTRHEPISGQEYEKKKKGSASTVVILILSLVAVALIGVLVFLGIRTFGGKQGSEGEKQNVARETESDGTELEESASSVEEVLETEPPVPETVPPSSEAPTLPSLPETSSSAAEAEYILPNSNSAYLTEADLAHLTKEQLRIARNEIYARHGRKFKDSALNDYFMSKSWYVPSIEPDRFNENVFNDYETANRKLIADYEKKMGY